MWNYNIVFNIAETIEMANREPRQTHRKVYKNEKGMSSNPLHLTMEFLSLQAVVSLKLSSDPKVEKDWLQKDSGEGFLPNREP